MRRVDAQEAQPTRLAKDENDESSETPDGDVVTASRSRLAARRGTSGGPEVDQENDAPLAAISGDSVPVGVVGDSEGNPSAYSPVPLPPRKRGRGFVNQPQSPRLPSRQSEQLHNVLCAGESRAMP